MKKIIFSLPLFLVAVSCNNSQNVKSTQEETDTVKTEVVKDVTPKQDMESVNEKVQRPAPGAPVSYSWEEAEKHAKSSGLKFKVCTGELKVKGKSADGKLVLVEFLELIRDPEDESDTKVGSPVTLEVDLTKSRFFNYEENSDFPLGGMEVVMEEAHLGNVRLFVTESVNDKYPLVLAAQEDVAG